MSLFSLFLALWALVASDLTVRHLDRDVRITDLYGTDRLVSAALECRPDGSPVLHVGPHADLATLDHELAHAHDCADDGALNASPIAGWRPSTRPGWVSDYCWNTDAEWYACWVVHERRISGPVEPVAGAPPNPSRSALRGLLAVAAFASRRPAAIR